MVWGALHGSFLCLDHWREERREAQGLPEPVLDRRARIVRRFITFNIVCVGWVFFRATSFLNAWDVFKQIPQHWSGPSPLVTSSVLLATIGRHRMPVHPGRLDGAATYRICGAFAR